MIKTSNLHEAVHYSPDFWTQLGNNIRSGHFNTGQLIHIDNDLLTGIRAVVTNLDDRNRFDVIAEKIRIELASKQKSGDRYWEELNLLYWLAAVVSFLFDEKRQARKDIKSIDPIGSSKPPLFPFFSYHLLGYKKLNLLTGEDRSLMVLTWGKPRNHKTLWQIHLESLRTVEPLQSVSTVDNPLSPHRKIQKRSRYLPCWSEVTNRKLAIAVSALLITLLLIWFFT